MGPRAAFTGRESGAFAAEFASERIGPHPWGPREGEKDESEADPFALSVGLGLVGVGGLASTASATFHDNRIREVHEGGATGDYVELQAFAAGQNFVGGKYINTYDGGGTLLTSTLIPSNVANGANQATILIAHDASTTGADVVNGGLNVVNTGGTVC